MYGPAKIFLSTIVSPNRDLWSILEVRVYRQSNVRAAGRLFNKTKLLCFRWVRGVFRPQCTIEWTTEEDDSQRLTRNSLPVSPSHSLLATRNSQLSPPYPLEGSAISVRALALNSARCPSFAMICSKWTIRPSLAVATIFSP